jgi:hypothetical protein
LRGFSDMRSMSELFMLTQTFSFLLLVVRMTGRCPRLWWTRVFVTWRALTPTQTWLAQFRNHDLICALTLSSIDHWRNSVERF